jgi:hypothetical protein
LVFRSHLPVAVGAAINLNADEKRVLIYPEDT